MLNGGEIGTIFQRTVEVAKDVFIKSYGLHVNLTEAKRRRLFYRRRTCGALTGNGRRASTAQSLTVRRALVSLILSHSTTNKKHRVSENVIQILPIPELV